MSRQPASRAPHDNDEVDDLRARLAEAEETLRAIRYGEVDAVLVTDEGQERIYTLRSADAPYRALVEQMQEGAALVRRNGDIVYCNSGFAELVGRPLQRVIGGSLDAYMGAEDHAEISELLRRGTGKMRSHVSKIGRSALDVHLSVSSVTLDGIDYRTMIVSDISSLTQAQRESRSKDEFLAMLAHELRNPLGAIGGAVQVLGLDKYREPAAVRACDVIQRQVQHMGRLVDDLLDVGRVVTGKIVLNPRPIDLAESVRTSVAAVTASRKVEGRVAVTAEPVWVHADPVRLEQVVGNLLSNALKFTPAERGVRISVGAEGPDAVITVADDGAGIDPELLPHIFDMFVQADDTIDRSKGGLGIGLTLVRRLIELHGGSVEATSDGKDHGSTFTLRLPAKPPPTAAKRSATATGQPQSKRVLLVDDNSDSREMYSLLLRSAGHDVYQAADGPSGVVEFERVSPEVAVVDIGLPGFDGHEVARRIRRLPGGDAVLLIALTGYGFPDDRKQSRAAGFDRHLVKPVSPDQLIRELQDAPPSGNAPALPPPSTR